jgi:hypothetical protein
MRSHFGRFKGRPAACAGVELVELSGQGGEQLLFG